jgi:hypothetical protein
MLKPADIDCLLTLMVVFFPPILRSCVKPTLLALLAMLWLTLSFRSLRACRNKIEMKDYIISTSGKQCMDMIGKQRDKTCQTQQHNAW